MKNEFTSGPWKRKEFTSLNGEPRAGVFSETTAGAVCWPTGADDATTSANARLIAAAPELWVDLCVAAKTLRSYEALHRAKGTAESTAKADVNAALASRFEATIAKATGGAA